MASPVDPSSKFGRVDQGVDYTSSKPYVAVGAGVVYHVGTGFAGGTGKAVYIRLDKPVMVNGRAYRDVYYAEANPLVKVGQRVREGQPVMSAGSAELGFASGNGPAAALVGGLGTHTQPTREGNDFLSFVKGAPTYAPPNPSGAVTPSGAPPDISSGDSTLSQPDMPPQPEMTQPQVYAPGTNTSSPYELWQRVVQASSSPDPQTLAYQDLAAQGG